MPKVASLFRFTIVQEKDSRQSSPSWLATLYSSGKRERKRFRTKAKAEGWVETRRTEVEKLGTQVDGLSREALADAVDARELLGEGESLVGALKELKLVRDALGSGAGLLSSLDELAATRKALGGRVGLLQAAEFWALHNPDGNALTLGQLAEEYLSAPRRGGTSPSHLRALRERFWILQQTFGEDKPVASIMADDLGGFLESRAQAQSWSPSSFNAWRGTLKSLFAYADAKHGTGNPAAGIERRNVPARKIEYYTPEQAEAILRAAEKVAPNYAAAVAILFFAGVRPAELVGQYGESGSGVIGGLLWNRVDVDGEIVLDKTKTNQRRSIPIPPNLAAWLSRYGKERGRVVSSPQGWKWARERIVKASGVEWGQDWPRHTFATYHFALHRNREALEAIMGHVEGGSAVLERHYKGLEKRAVAERFWAIMPTATAAENKGA